MNKDRIRVGTINEIMEEKDHVRFPGDCAASDHIINKKP